MALHLWHGRHCSHFQRIQKARIEASTRAHQCSAMQKVATAANTNSMDSRHRRKRLVPCKDRIRHAAAGAGNAGAGVASGSPFADLMQAIQAQMQGQTADNGPPSAEVEVQNLSYNPAGTHLAI